MRVKCSLGESCLALSDSRLGRYAMEDGWTLGGYTGEYRRGAYKCREVRKRGYRRWRGYFCMEVRMPNTALTLPSRPGS
eukprot:scaffold1839_cov382-Prasinococcus_capsulatus_cf.AAC.18